MPIIIFGLGSNLGSPEQNLQLAVLELQKVFGEVLYKSKIYHSKPLVKHGAPDFFHDLFYLNSAIAFESNEDPLHILKKIKEIEIALGRGNKAKWEPRVIDIDILIYKEVKSLELKIPHPELLNRDFALIPLIETLEALKLPTEKYKTALQSLKNLNSLFVLK